jgi:putative sugar O-methyltransferase
VSMTQKIDGNELTNDHELFSKIMASSRAATGVYAPGPYWIKKATNAIHEIDAEGISIFRGLRSGVGTSYSDSPRIDVRNDLGTNIAGKALKRILQHVYPFKNVLDASAAITTSHFMQAMVYKNLYRNSNARVKEILAEFKDLNTVIGCPVDVINPESPLAFSNHYLDLIDTQLNFGDEDFLSKAESILEIGGGFGANVHIMLHRFQNIKKVVYLDIAPNLYVAMQYFTHIFGKEAVRFFSQAEGSKLRFKGDSSLEIVCILPQEIENLDVEIEVFWNAHSFVEMTEPIVKNYAANMKRISSKKEARVYLASYDQFSLDSTLDPKVLLDIFGSDLNVREFETLEPERHNIHIWGKFS